MVGPSFKGIYGRKGKLQGGADYVANDEYIKHSIQKPMDQVVDGYPPAMPALGLSDAEIADIIEFMKTVK